MPVRPDFLQNLEALLVRQHDIEDDQFVASLKSGSFAFHSRMNGMNLKTFGFKVLRDQITKLYVIIHHQETGGPSRVPVGIRRHRLLLHPGSHYLSYSRRRPNERRGTTTGSSPP